MKLRPAEITDEDWLFNLQCEPGTRQYARNTALPTPEEHAAWMRRVLANPDIELMLVEEEGSVGMVRLDRIDGNYEVSIAISLAHRGKGYASKALKLIRDMKPTAVFEAEISPVNTASVKLFRRAGYTPAGGNRYHARAA